MELTFYERHLVRSLLAAENHRLRELVTEFTAQGATPEVIQVLEERATSCLDLVRKLVREG